MDMKKFARDLNMNVPDPMKIAFISEIFTDKDRMSQEIINLKKSMPANAWEDWLYHFYNDLRDNDIKIVHKYAEKANELKK